MYQEFRNRLTDEQALKTVERLFEDDLTATKLTIEAESIVSEFSDYVAKESIREFEQRSKRQISNLVGYSRGLIIGFLIGEALLFVLLISAFHFGLRL